MRIHLLQNLNKRRDLIFTFIASFLFITLSTCGMLGYLSKRKGLSNETAQVTYDYASFGKFIDKSGKAPVDLDQINPSTLQEIPLGKTLKGIDHIFQTFNNCGPASLSMVLSFYDINISQQTLGQELRPYQHPKGDNDDKSVTLYEMAEKSKEYGFVPFHRPAGDMDKIMYFITYDMPVITRTWLKIDEDVGHYRVVKGFDKVGEYIIQDDSLQGKNIKYSFDEFNLLWKKFNYEYLVLVPEEKVEIAEMILGEDVDLDIAWQKAVELSMEQLKENPNDVYARFNLSVAYYNLDEYEKSIEEFEKVENDLAFRTLWYQIEPILAYYKMGDYDRVFSISDNVLNNNNRAYSELYLLRGEIYKEQGREDLALEEFKKAVYYNKYMSLELIGL